MVERFNGRIEDVLQSHRFRSGEDLEQTILRYVRLYNGQLPQSVLKGRTPIDALKDWQRQRPDIFKKRPYNHAGCDNYALNIEFHDLLIDAANNARARSVYSNLVKEMHLYRRRGLSIAANIARSIKEHEAVVAAVAAGDEEAAARAANRHIKSGLNRYMQILGQEAGTTG